MSRDFCFQGVFNPNPGIEPTSPASLTYSLPLSHLGRPRRQYIPYFKKKNEMIKWKAWLLRPGHDWANESNQQTLQGLHQCQGSCACGLWARASHPLWVLPLGPQREGVCASFPMTPDTAKQKGHMAWGWEDIYDNLAMESIWHSPARSGKLGQESQLMIKSSFSLCVVKSSPPHKVQDSWASGPGVQKYAEKVAPREPCPECISHHRALGANLNLVSILKTGNSLTQNVIFLPFQSRERRPKELTSSKPRVFFFFFLLPWEFSEYW